MREIIYDRRLAVSYAKKWAYERNPKYYDFSDIGGDCTNFVSQCIYAGIGVMNYTKDYGWYYITSSDRSPSWTAAQYLNRFLLNNDSVGPYGTLTDSYNVDLGDIVQFENEEGRIYHSLMITKLKPQILVTTHSFNAYNRPLSTYNYYKAYFIHIEGGRTE